MCTDLDDEHWKTFLLFVKANLGCMMILDAIQTHRSFKREEAGGQTRYSAAGFVTVYEYFGFPNHIRPRIRLIA